FAPSGYRPQGSLSFRPMAWRGFHDFHRHGAGTPAWRGGAGWSQPFSRRSWFRAGAGEPFGPFRGGVRPGFPFRAQRRWPWMWGGSAAPGGMGSMGPMDAGSVNAGPMNAGSMNVGPMAPGAPADDPQLISWAQSCLGRLVGSWVPQDGAMSGAT